jgi:hypothetical protein
MTFDQRGGYQAGVRRDVEHAIRRCDSNGSDKGAAPARVLAEAQKRTDGVVFRRDAREELERARLAQGRDHSHREECSGGSRGRRQPATRNAVRKTTVATSRAIESTMAPL